MKRIYIDEVMCIASVCVFVFSVFFQIDQGRVAERRVFRLKAGKNRKTFQP